MKAGDRMRNLRSATVWVTMALTVVGCAAPEIPFDRSLAPGVKTIGIVTPSFPDDAAIRLASSVGQSFGLIGALIDAGIESSRASKFKDILVRQNFSVQEIFVQDMTAALRSQGYNVVVIAVTRDKADFLTAYPATSGRVDAYLDLVVTNFGYIAAGIKDSTPYRPWFSIRARLVNAKDSSVLMQDLVIYNAIGPGTDHAVTVSPDPAYEFKDFDALTGNPTNAVKGLQVAIEQSAQTVGTLLK